MKMAENNDQQRSDMELLIKGLIGMLRDAADTEVKRSESESAIQKRLRTQVSTTTAATGDQIDGPVTGDTTDGLSTAQSSIVFIRNVAERLYTFFESSSQGKCGLDADNFGQVVDVVSRLVGVLCPVLSLFSIADVFCRYDSKCHDIMVRQYKNTVEDDDVQIGQLKARMEKISTLINNMWKNIDAVLRKSRWLPAEVDRIDSLLGEIGVEIEIAKTQFRLSQDWLQKLEQEFIKYERQMTMKNVIVWVGVLAVSGGLYYWNRIDPVVATVLAAAGCIPLCHSYFSLSFDIMQMSADIRDKQRRNDQLEVNLKAYEVQLGRLRARRGGDRTATADSVEIADITERQRNQPQLVEVK